MQEKIMQQLSQIEAAVNAVYVRGCDDVSLSNMAQLRGIWQSVQRIKQLMKEEDKDA